MLTMTHEIEIKLKYEHKQKLIEKLEEIGAKLKKKETLEDTYFSLDHTDMSNTHDLIRIRKKNGKAELTFKGKCETESDIWKRIELNTEINDPDMMTKILEYLHFNTLLQNKSQREYWTLDNVEIVFIDLVKPLRLSWIEIEGPSEGKIQRILDKLGNDVEKIGEDFFKKLDQI